MMTFDLPDPHTKKWVVVVTAIGDLRREIDGVKRRGPSVLKRLQKPDMGFKSKTKVKMLAEITAWLDNVHTADRREDEDYDMDDSL
jgi:hypothetical protein